MAFCARSIGGTSTTCCAPSGAPPGRPRSRRPPYLDGPTHERCERARPRIESNHNSCLFNPLLVRECTPYSRTNFFALMFHGFCDGLLGGPGRHELPFENLSRPRAGGPRSVAGPRMAVV